MEDLTKTYQVGETQVRALRGISYEIRKLMNIIGCLDKPTNGRYFLEGKEVSTYNKNQLAGIRNSKIGFVFQTFNLLARTTALENTELPLLYSNTPAREAKKFAMKALAQVGLEGRELHKSNQMSGGERQRVAIARALVNNPSENGITVILVTHDPEVSAIAEKKMHIRDGLIESLE